MDRYIWKAYYNDGSFISQTEINPETGREWSSDHVPKEQLKAVCLEPTDTNARPILLQVKEGESFRRFWRRYFGTENGEDRGTCWVLVLEKNGVEVYTFVRPDGSIVISTDSEASEFSI